MKNILADLQAIYRYRYVVVAYVETNVKIRYRRSYLGFFWTMLAPVLHYLIIGLVFSVIVKSRQPNYFSYYFSGALLFGLINGVLSKAPNFFIGNEHFLKKVAVPKMIYVLNGISYEIVTFLLSSIGLLVLAILCGRIQFCWPLLWSLAAVPILAFFLFGLACLVAVMTVYFRDIFYIMPVILQAVFFVTPIVFTPEIIPDRFKIFLTINPIVYFLDMFRQPIVDQMSPSMANVGICLAAAMASTALGFALVKKFENRIVFKL